MQKVYPAIIHEEKDGMWIDFPDLQGCYSDGNSIEDVMRNAEEAMGLYLATIIESGEKMPPATSLEKVTQGKNGIKTYISVDVDRFHRETKAVRKTVSIPLWQAKAAEKKQLSLSKVLQQALDEFLV